VVLEKNVDGAHKWRSSEKFAWAPGLHGRESTVRPVSRIWEAGGRSIGVSTPLGGVSIRKCPQAPHWSINLRRALMTGAGYSGRVALIWERREHTHEWGNSSEYRRLLNTAAAALARHTIVNQRAPSTTFPAGDGSLGESPGAGVWFAIWQTDWFNRVSGSMRPGSAWGRGEACTDRPEKPRRPTFQYRWGLRQLPVV